MDPLVIVHVAAAATLVATAVAVGIWGNARARQLARPVSTKESRGFSHLLQLTHTLVLATGLFGVALLVEGHGVSDPLHARVYGPFMVVAIVAAYGYRTGNARRNVRVFAASALVIAALGLRAFYTG